VSRVGGLFLLLFGLRSAPRGDQTRGRASQREDGTPLRAAALVVPGRVDVHAAGGDGLVLHRRCHLRRGRLARYLRCDPVRSMMPGSGDADLQAVLEKLDPKARDHLPRVAIPRADRPRRDLLALMHYRDDNGRPDRLLDDVAGRAAAGSAAAGGDRGKLRTIAGRRYLATPRGEHSRPCILPRPLRPSPAYADPGDLPQRPYEG
jgi:hypothetical protein